MVELLFFIDHLLILHLDRRPILSLLNLVDSHYPIFRSISLFKVFKLEPF